MSKYKDLIKQARKQDSQKTRKPEQEQLPDKEVNLSIKVSERRRRHWVSEAKKQGTSLTAVILEALSNRFGEP